MILPVKPAVEAALAAAALLRDARPERVDHKGRIDLVTELDVACERVIREVLARHTPDIPVLGEEGGGATSARTRWVVDPLDGTTNFVHGFPVYAVSIGLEVDGEPVVGVVADPVSGRVYRAARGQGAFVDDVRLRVSDAATVSTALLGTGFAYDRRERADFYLARFRVMLERSRGLRRAGSAATDLTFVARGALDGFWEFGLKRWDVTAGIVLVQEAGGVVTDHSGRPVFAHPDATGQILATNKRLHGEMMELLAAVR